MNDVIKIIKSLEDSNIIIDGITETAKNKIKRQEGGFLPPLLSTLMQPVQPLQPVVFSVVKGIRERGVRRAG